MNEIITKENVKIENLIYEIRGKQVMLDSDLALLYGTETKRINEAVSRNKEKFPERFSFRLIDEEVNIFLVANCDQKKETRGGRYKNPRVFTEEGVAMLATILKTKIATEVSIAIMDAFVAMRKYISTNLIQQKYINEQVLKNTKRIDLIEETLSNFKEKTNHLFFNGQIYDAYSKIIDIFKEAKEELVIIDGYADKSVLDMVRNLKVKVLLVTKKNSLLTKQDIDKYKKQYNSITIIYSDYYYDRYFILDRETIYHSGTSVNHAGTRTFSINKWEDKSLIDSFIKDFDNIIR